MKQLLISGALDSDPALRAQIQRATQTLEEIIGPTASLVTADWSLPRDTNGRGRVVLTLTDFTGALAETRFTPEELDRQGQLYAKLYKIWGDLLQYRSHKQLDILSGKVQAGE